MVVHRGSSQRGDLSSPALSRPNVLVRCLQPRLGGDSRRSLCLRRLAGGRGLSFDQPSRAVGLERGPRVLCVCLEGWAVAVFSDNTTAVAYLRRQGGILSPALNAVAQRILRWAEQLNIVLMPQFVPGRNNVVADALSRPNQVIGSEWVLHQVVFNWLRERLAGDNRYFRLLTQSPLLLFILLLCRIPWLRVRMPCSSHGIRYRRMPSLPSP